MSKCYAVQYSDQMVCERCHQTWDVNDVYEPECKPECKPGAAHVTLRDQFAMAALAGLASGNGLYSPCDIAKYAYMAADAMLKERVK